MNFLRKTLLALSLVAVVPAMQAWPACLSWETISGKARNFCNAVVSKTPNKEQVSNFARDAKTYANTHRKTTAAIGVGTVAAVAGAGYLAKKYNVHGKVANAAGSPKRLAKSAYARFAALSKTKKGVVIGGALVATAGVAYLTYRLLSNKANSGK